MDDAFGSRVIGRAEGQDRFAIDFGKVSSSLIATPT
jgi:hypothetical protein